MRIRHSPWPGLLAAPLLALGDQSVAYAFAPYGCSHQHLAGLHAVHLAFLVATLACAWLAWPGARPALRAMRNDEGGSTQRHDLFAVLGFLMGLFSAAIVVALWIPQWVLSPCSG